MSDSNLALEAFSGVALEIIKGRDKVDTQELKYLFVLNIKK